VPSISRDSIFGYFVCRISKEIADFKVFHNFEQSDANVIHSLGVCKYEIRIMAQDKSRVLLYHNAAQGNRRRSAKLYEV
jgi:hypothetical protein